MGGQDRNLFFNPSEFSLPGVKPLRCEMDVTFAAYAHLASLQYEKAERLLARVEQSGILAQHESLLLAEIWRDAQGRSNPTRATMHGAEAQPGGKGCEGAQPQFDAVTADREWAAYSVARYVVKY